MQMPETLKIGGHIYQVIQKHNCKTDEGSICCGRHSGAEEIIEINPDYPEGTQESTLIHEILEAINWSSEIGLEHRQISALETGLYQVLKDNCLHFDE